MKKNLFLSFVAMLLSMATYAISGITGSHTVCVGSSTTLMDSTAGGVWSSSNTSIAYIGSTGTTYGIAAGAVTITYTATGISVYYSFTVNPQPAHFYLFAVSMRGNLFSLF